MSDHHRDQHRTILGHFIKKPNKGIFKKQQEQAPAEDDEAKKSKSPFLKWVQRASGGQDGC